MASHHLHIKTEFQDVVVHPVDDMDEEVFFLVEEGMTTSSTVVRVSELAHVLDMMGYEVKKK